MLDPRESSFVCNPVQLTPFSRKDAPPFAARRGAFHVLAHGLILRGAFAI
jgi:hypothetical protein